MGKRGMLESVVKHGNRTARLLRVKLDCLNPNPTGECAHSSERTLVNDGPFCIGMNRGLVHSLSGKKDQRGLKRDEWGPYGELERISKTYHGTPYGGRPLGEQSARSSQHKRNSNLVHGEGAQGPRYSAKRGMRKCRTPQQS
jgi:hypothetical protein